MLENIEEREAAWASTYSFAVVDTTTVLCYIQQEHMARLVRNTDFL